MKYVCAFISLIFFNQILCADITVGYIGGTNTYSECAYQGTVIDLNKINSDIELLISIKDNLNGKSSCTVPPSENINLLVPENKEIKIGSVVKFSVTKILNRRSRGGKFYDFKDITESTEFEFKHWE